MKIQYSLTFKEHLRCSALGVLRSMRTNPRNGYLLGIFMLGPFIVPIVEDAYIAHAFHLSLFFEWKWVLKMYILYPISVALGLGICTVIAWPMLRKGQVEISSEEITWACRWFKNRKPWMRINLFEEDSEYIYVGSMGAWQAAMSLILPKRAFASSKEATDFFDMALGYLRQAHSDALANTPASSGAWPPAPRVRPGKSSQG